MDRIKILDIRIDNLSFVQTLQRIREFIISQQPHQICTVNSEFIMAAQKNQEFARVLNNSALNVPDGYGLLWAAKYILRQSLRERVTGVDLTWEIAKMAMEKGYSIYFLGGDKNVAKQAVQILRQLYPRLKIAGAESGGVIDLNKPNEILLTRIKKSRPDILLVAFGAPKQELWIARYQPALKIPVAIGVGGTFDFIIGRAKRAPQGWQKLGLEWLWRLIHEPQRWHRIFTAIIKFPLAVIWSKLTKKT